MIKQDLKDAISIAAAGLDQTHDENSNNLRKSSGSWVIDFKKEAGIDYFGPEPNNVWEQDSISGMMH